MNNAKYGVVFYPQTDNLGDHIQTYAAACQLPHVDYVIDRENMDIFESDNHEPIGVLMNGWYMHNKANFIISRDICPLCLSMHFSKYDYFDIGYDFLTGAGKAWLEEFQPIGCRDDASVAACQQNGIKAYFSGCMTLTLPKPKKTENREKYICVVDLDESGKSALKSLVDEKMLVFTTHTLKSDRVLSFDEAMKAAEEQLTLLGNARCVLTTRLHCALPCLAMGVPVILINDKSTDVSRFSNYLSMLNVISPKELEDGRFPYDLLNPEQNSNTYLKFRTELMKRIQAFIKEEIKRQNLSETDRISQQVWQRKMNDRMIDNAKNRILYLTKSNAEMQQWTEKMKAEQTELLEKNAEMQRWAEKLKEEKIEFLEKNAEMQRWAKELKTEKIELLKKNEELVMWGLNSKQQIEDLMNKNKELFEWAKSLEAQL